MKRVNLMLKEAITGVIANISKPKYGNMHVYELIYVCKDSPSSNYTNNHDLLANFP